MSQNEYTCTYTTGRPSREGGHPEIDVRIARLNKIADREFNPRYLSLASTDELRRLEQEKCCKRMCDLCLAGKPVGRDSFGTWWHEKMSSTCGAQVLREKLHEEKRRATDANAMDSIAPMPPVHGKTERRGHDG